MRERAEMVEVGEVGAGVVKVGEVGAEMVEVGEVGAELVKVGEVGAGLVCDGWVEWVGITGNGNGANKKSKCGAVGDINARGLDMEADGVPRGRVGEALAVLELTGVWCSRATDPETERCRSTSRASTSPRRSFSSWRRSLSTCRRSVSTLKRSLSSWSRFFSTSRCAFCVSCAFSNKS
ncbi:hypothetical protein J4Q44_G00253890 [Coregonus suidteri]|uniref:Uncharacterized protein n=1 Tax=Coregonus suidteri TaxID=861788 RepID=A0AAN8QNV7_9TELE